MGDGATTFSISATWDASAKEGRLANPEGSFAIVHTGATALDGKGGTANPEELLLAAVATCFVQTWAIFLEKLKVPIDAPRIDGTCLLEKDPAGGFRVTRVDLVARVPGDGPRDAAGGRREDALPRREVLHRLEGREGIRPGVRRAEPHLTSRSAAGVRRPWM